MKAANLRDQTDEELGNLYEDTKREFFELKMKKGSGDSSEQPLKVRGLRRDVARIKTVLRERERKNAIEHSQAFNEN
ncbi:50S ribosomal protein L29 [Verrucomicrobiota bacterium]